jgi:Na+-translocating ferredoxin:NAD+ oxidoreductase RNF subunit RnfB
MIVSSVIILVGLGVVFGMILGYANKKFAVKEDPRIVKVEEALAGANCGACGYPGCSVYAEAIINKGAPIDKCTPGGSETLAALAEIMGLKAGKKKIKIISYLLCQGDCELAPKKSEYVGVKSCAEAKFVGGGDKSCSFGCLGYSDCEVACPFDAIHINEKGLPIVDEERCTGCGICVNVCPQNILVLQPIDKDVLIRCKNQEVARNVLKECKIGCISCGLCEKNCPIAGAITIENNLAVMHYEECVDCGICAVVCPKHTITDKRKEERKIPVITDKCTGCTMCARVCPVDAISGKVKEQHKIDPEKCIGCLKCYDVCRFDAIELIEPRPKIIPFYKEKKYNKTTKEYVNR